MPVVFQRLERWGRKMVLLTMRFCSGVSSVCGGSEVVSCCDFDSDACELCICEVGYERDDAGLFSTLSWV